MKRIRLENLLVVIGFTSTTAMLSFVSMDYILEQTSTISMFLALYIGSSLFSIVGLFLFNRMQDYSRKEELIDAQQQQLILKENAVRTLREQRHDLLNELALISSYIQMDRPKEALQCIEYTAASLSDKYQVAELPGDAWLTVLGPKQAQARERGINLEVPIDERVVQGSNEQRLIPRIIANLVDNAFEAVSEVDNPWVRLEYNSQSKRRILSVINNGGSLSPEEIELIFKPGYSSKSGDGHGWGLPICQKTARELGGQIECESGDGITKFSLILPDRKQCVSE